MALKAVLLTDLGDVIAEKEFVAIVRFPAAVYLDGCICILRSIKGNQGIYQSVNYYRFPDTPVEAESEKVMAQRWELSHD
ncbi:hypothetical protein [Nostoc sp.]|uniref:hypothetical protein n=1 Tax=Nostoc sp. TaxID=1180 RepID=UPI002FF7CB22